MAERHPRPYDSVLELIGSEIEHGGSQSTTVSWLLDPQYFFVDSNGDMGTTLIAMLNGETDTVFFRHGWDLKYMGVLSSQTPTISIGACEWQ